MAGGANSIIRAPPTRLTLPVQFLLANWYLVLVALVSGGLLLWPTLRQSVAGGGPNAVATGEAVRLINREKAVLIDVCEPDEYAAGHAAGAKNVPLGKLEGSNDLPKNKALPLVILCQTGARSARAAGILKKLGFEKPVVLAGGLAAWREANLPVEKASS